MSAKPANCRCETTFTCGVCLDRCVARNLADRNNAPLAWYENACINKPSPCVALRSRSITNRATDNVRPVVAA